jgi:hypothetical protein
MFERRVKQNVYEKNESNKIRMNSKAFGEISSIGKFVGGKIEVRHIAQLAR